MLANYIASLLIGFLIAALWFEFFSRTYICHICEDESRKISKFEYQSNDGAHKECADGRFPKEE